jgi:uncharacterized protein (DUF983 family)
MPPLPDRRSDSPLEMPSTRRALRLAGRAFRLRCPHCGDGPVLKWSGSVQRRCRACNFRFERSDENYFSGAMFFGLLMGEFIFGISLFIIVFAMWPNVPWDTMMWAVPLGVLLTMVFVIPASRAVWLTIDVLVRPVERHELID